MKLGLNCYFIDINGFATFDRYDRLLLDRSLVDLFTAANSALLWVCRVGAYFLDIETIVLLYCIFYLGLRSITTDDERGCVCATSGSFFSLDRSRDDSVKF